MGTVAISSNDSSSAMNRHLDFAAFVFAVGVVVAASVLFLLAAVYCSKAIRMPHAEILAVLALCCNLNPKP